MDEFKKYLREHRYELDVESPPRSEVWQHIQQQVTVRRKTVITPLFRRVAAACLVLLAGATAYMLWVREPQDEVVAKPQPHAVKQNNPERDGQTSTSAPAISPLPGEVIADTVGTLAKNWTILFPRSAVRRLVWPFLKSNQQWMYCRKIMQSSSTCS